MCASSAAAWRSSTQGEVILQGDPQRVLDEVRGRMWRKRIRKSEMADVRARFNVISLATRRGRSGGARVQRRVAGRRLHRVEPVLEDVYFHRVGEPALAEA